MTQKAIGSDFVNELNRAGLIGLPFSWSPDGTITFGSTMTQDQINAVEAVYAAHDPTTPDPNATYATAIAAGIAITSTGTSALNATYALDQTSQDQLYQIAS